MIIQKLKQQLSSQFIRNVISLGGAELVSRIFRLGTTVTLARQLSPYDYGLAAIVLTTNEFATVFTVRAGIGSKLIQADEQNVNVLSDTAYWMNWILSVSLFITQCIAAFPIAWFYKDKNVILPICVAATVYLIMPIFAVQSALINRENRLKITALCNVTQSVIGSILSIVLALLGMGIWAIVLPIVLTTPVWIAINLTNHSWRPPKSFTLNQWQEIANYAKNILGVELLDKLRANLDYLLVGRFLGVDALGFYFFAFNAGLGISLNVMNLFVWALFPHLCNARGELKLLKEKYFSSLRTIALILVPLVLLQASLAPFYVPIVFGQKWVIAIPILVITCLSALPRPFANAASLLLQAVDKAHINLYWNLIFTVIFVISLLVSVKWGIFWVAASVLISHVLAMPIFTIWATRYVFETNLSLIPAKEKI